MTREQRKNWHRDWEVDAQAGEVRHLGTGLVARVRPDPPGQPPREPPDGWEMIGRCELPAGVVDRRQAGAVASGDPNAVGLERWGVICARDGAGSLAGALQVLLEHEQLGPHNAKMRLQRLVREAGDAWVYRARLDRERPRHT